MSSESLPTLSDSRHVVMFSGGAGSWAAAKRAAMGVGADKVTLLFADTLVEDADLYRFLDSAAENIGAELVRVADGRTPFEVFKDDRFLGNARLANCSKYLKIEPCREWLEANCDPDRTILYVGIDWSEIHRLPAITKGWAPYEVRAPLCQRPYLSKQQILDWLKAERLTPPAAYAEGFPHNNCLQQGCVRGGQAYWRLLLRTRPDVYRRTEALEEDLRQHLDANVAMLRDRRGGYSSPLTLRGFREQIEMAPELFDHEEWGGCGCFVEDVATPIDDALSAERDHMMNTLPTTDREAQEAMDEFLDLCDDILRIEDEAGIPLAGLLDPDGAERLRVLGIRFAALGQQVIGAFADDDGGCS